MALYLSNYLAANNTLLWATQNFTATQGQTTFNFGYTAPYVEAYLNGVKLVKDSDFTANDGSTVVLSSGARAGDSVDLVRFKAGEIRNDQLINAGSNLLGGGSISGDPTINLADTVTIHKLNANTIASTGPVTAPVVTANTVSSTTLTSTTGAFTGLVTAPTVTANTFIGDGSQLTNAGISTGKAIAMAIVFG